MSDDKEPQGNPWIKSLAIWAGILLALVLFVSMFESGTRATAGESIAYSEFLSRVDEGTVKEADIGDGVISGKMIRRIELNQDAPET